MLFTTQQEPSFTGGLQGIYELLGILQEIQLTFPHTAQTSMPQNEITHIHIHDTKRNTLNMGYINL